MRNDLHMLVKSKGSPVRAASAMQDSMEGWLRPPQPSALRES